MMNQKDAAAYELEQMQKTGADDAAGWARLVGAGSQALLQRDALAAAQRAFVLRPAGQQRSAAIQALAEQAHGQGVGRGVVVLEDGVEVAEHQEDRAAMAGRQ